MILILAGLALAVLAGLSVWRVADRWWHLGVIVLIALPLLRLFARTVTGDVSRYLPAGMFSEGAAGKDEIILASVAATVLLAVLLATGLFALAKAVWRLARRSGR